jgi:hypothetical protein
VRHALSRLLALVAGVALLAFIVSRYPLADVGAALVAIGPAALATPLIALVWQAANTRAFQALVGPGVGFVELFRAKLAGDGLGTLLPYGTIAGEAVRMRLLARRLSGAHAVAAVLVDRAVGDGLGLAYSAVAVALLVAKAAPGPALRAGLVLYAVVAAAGAAVLVALVATRFPGRAGAFVARRLGGAAAAAPRPAPSPGALGAALAWQLAGRVIGLAEVAVLLARLDLPSDLLTCLTVHGAIAAAGYVTFATPTGIGVADAACVFAFGVLGFPGEAAVAFALARRARLLVVAGLGVAWQLARPGSRETS